MARTCRLAPATTGNKMRLRRSLAIRLLLVGVLSALTRPALAAEGFEEFSARGNDSEAVIKAMLAWLPALEKASGKQVHAATLLVQLLRFDPIWDEKDRLRPHLSARYVARLGSLTPAQTQEWRGALAERTAQPPGMVDTALWIVRQDRLFRDQLDEAVAQQQFDRLRSLPREVVQRWSARSTHDELEAVLELLGSESLYEDRRFQPAQFELLVSRFEAENPFRDAEAEAPGRPLEKQNEPPELPPPPPEGFLADASDASDETGTGAGDSTSGDEPQFRPREWTLADGRSAELTFFRLRDGVVQLANDRGEVADVPMEMLSAPDRRWVERVAASSGDGD